MHYAAHAWTDDLCLSPTSRLYEYSSTGFDRYGSVPMGKLCTHHRLVKHALSICQEDVFAL